MDSLTIKNCKLVRHFHTCFCSAINYHLEEKNPYILVLKFKDIAISWYKALFYGD